MKILLIVPPYRTTDALTAQLYPMPYGPVLIATALEAKGHQVKLIDFLLPASKSKTKQPASFAGLSAPPYLHYGRPLEDCKQWLETNVPDYDVVGLAMGQCNIFETGQQIAAIVKELGRPLVVGGAFASTAPQQAMEMTDADVLVIGEAEVIAVDAFSLACAGEKKVLSADPVDLSVLPLPDWRRFAPLENYPKYKGKVRGVLSISRGCPYRCRFCSVHTIAGRKHRRQGSDRIRTELLNLADAGARYICFLDDNLFISEKATHELLTIISELKATDRRFNQIRFYVEEGIEIRLAAIPGLIAEIAAVGFENIALGLETMNEATRSQMKKPYSPQELEAAIDHCRKAKVRAKAFYIVGFPGDTVESVCKDLTSFGRLGLAARPNNLKLYPGTDVTREFNTRGYIDASYDWRLSSWYTPASGGINYSEIKQLKTVLGAIGHAAEDFGIALFADSAQTIATNLKGNRYSISQQGDEIRIEGNMYRPTAFRHMAELMLLRQGAAGAQSKQQNNLVVAWPLLKPRNKIQAALKMHLSTIDLFSAALPTKQLKDAGPRRGHARCFRQDLMKGENLTWVRRRGKELDDTSRRILTSGRKPMGATPPHGPNVRQAADGTLQYQETRGTSIFDPVLCELIYRWFCPPGGQVVDPFAGGSVRGIVAGYLGRRYWGCDLRPEQIAANEAQAGILPSEKTVPPDGIKPNLDWICGDALELLDGAPEADLVFSCPPYGDLERYSEDPRDLSTMTWPDFLAAYRTIIAKAVGRLRPDRFACFVVGDFRDNHGFYRALPWQTVRAFEDAGMRLYNEAVLITAIGSLPIRIGAQFTGGRKLGKTHQNVLVFINGDPRRATAAVGEVEFGDLEAPGETAA